MSKSSADKLKAVIAVDFGTTCSALCWALAGDPNGTQLIDRWPGDAATSNKVPTTLRYENDKTYWGLEIKDQERRHEWFKLGLYPDAPESDLMTKYPSPTALQREYQGDQVERLVVDYLTKLRKHAEKTMVQSYGEEDSGHIEKEYIITVPAIWTEQAQDRTLRCARKAGMGDQVRIITEPEAAGIYALAKMRHIGLRVNDTFVVCDAGGGTVDLVSYTVHEVSPVPVFIEAAQGTGGLCGSTFLNRIFFKFLKDRFQHYPDWDEDFQADAMQRFEDNTKKNFKGETTTKHRFRATRLHAPSLGIKNGILEISGSEINSMFDQVIPKIVDLVKAQIRATKRPVKAVLMAGGFGMNGYLQKRIKEAIPRNIEIRSVLDSETAIVRGALLRGLSEKQPGQPYRVAQRYARRHYGTWALETFNDFDHDISKRIPSPFSNGYRVKLMDWFIKKGTLVDESNPSQTSVKFFYERKVVDGHPEVIAIKLYACDQEKPPKYFDESEEIHCLGEIKADIRRIPKEQFLQQRGLGNQLFYKIPYAVRTTVYSGRIHFTLVYMNKTYEFQTDFV